MFNGFLRFFIFVTTLFVAWLATGRLLAATHPPDWWWLGYVQATGVELVLAYCVWLVARTTEKGLVGLMILFFGLFSISAQVMPRSSLSPRRCSGSVWRACAAAGSRTRFPNGSRRSATS